jgi:predicted Fe-Mo cluster-binding NifX family protein
MIIFISAMGSSFDSQMSARYGRALWFIRYDTETSDWQAIENMGPNLQGGAGVSTSQLLMDQGAKAVISGHFGPNAKQALQAGGITMFSVDADQLTVDEAVRQYQSGLLTANE